MLDVARRSFKKMMGGIGYGRIDVRINRKRNDEVVFLEINPNCGIMYPVDQEGSADWILKLSPDLKQNEFAKLQIREALRIHDENRILYARRFDHVRGYHLRAVEDIPEGTVIFADECRPVRLCTKPYVQEHFSGVDFDDFCHSAWPIGADKHYYALWDRDPGEWRSFNHSCSPNMAFAPNRSLNVVALRLIKKGEELTMDYMQFMDDTMQPFKCFWGLPIAKGRYFLANPETLHRQTT
ncbi:hypothetical protein STCU_04838 [Strigomonas culicis]|uniref:SET domain-containing protein n=1 Tax=Strigomonas culicis TaxID=28005 RepID=S9UJD4_9TRYP|nr:hypothetical protein STCU_04838 [Strigomonas culicis]|eukprot:EPY28874.1 hypothetical protein STCU_04838 [Strigomonas culicis]